MNAPAHPMPQPPARRNAPWPGRARRSRAVAGAAALSALWASLTLLSTEARAKAYLGLSVGEASTGLDCASTTTCDRTDTAWKLFGGYMLHPNFGLEASYRDSGRARLSGTVGGSTLSDRFRSESVDLYALAMTREGALSGFLKAGFATTRARGVASVVDMGSPDRETHTRPAWGLGVGWDFTPSLTARIEFERTRVRFGGDDRDIDTWSAGLMTRF